MADLNWSLDDFSESLAVNIRMGATEEDIQIFLDGVIEEYRAEVLTRAKSLAAASPRGDHGAETKET